MALLSLITTVTFAQKVYRADISGDSYPYTITKNNQSGKYYVIDTEGMPEGAIRTNAEYNSSLFETIDGKRRVYRHVQTAGNGTNPTVNAKVSRRFAVCVDDINSTGTIENNATMSWMAASGWDTDANNNLNASAAPADTGCPMYAGPDGGEDGLWRLPTERELQLIWIMHEGLKKLSGFTSFNANDYWSATEGNTDNAWYVRFSTALTSNHSKTNSNRVRPIRDL